VSGVRLFVRVGFKLCSAFTRWLRDIPAERLVMCVICKLLTVYCVPCDTTGLLHENAAEV
jgi:hypothetical protein